MNKQEIQNKIEELEKQLSKLKKELNGSESKAFKPEYLEMYYQIYCSGEIDGTEWIDNKYDNDIYAIGNCFRTREEAEFEVEKLKVIAELKRFAKEHNESVDWDDVCKLKYCIAFNVELRHIYYDFSLVVKRNDIYFSSKELAQQAVAEIGEERLRKYYFEVEDEN